MRWFVFERFVAFHEMSRIGLFYPRVPRLAESEPLFAALPPGNVNRLAWFELALDGILAEGFEAEG